MNKSAIKEKIETYKGKMIHFKYNGARNQIEEFDGFIEGTYNAIFTIRINDTDNIKSFTYNDLINKSLQIFL